MAVAVVPAGYLQLKFSITFDIAQLFSSDSAIKYGYVKSTAHTITAPQS